MPLAPSAPRPASSKPSHGSKPEPSAAYATAHSAGGALNAAMFVPLTQAVALQLVSLTTSETLRHETAAQHVPASSAKRKSGLSTSAAAATPPSAQPCFVMDQPRESIGKWMRVTTIDVKPMLAITNHETATRPNSAPQSST